MIIDFSQINGRECPTLVLRSMDGRAIQTLGYAFNITLEPNYNELSVLSFSVPARVDGVRVPGYEKLIGMQIIDMVGVGQFIVNNPDVTETSSKGVKNVKAYSLEYEFTFKKLTLAKSTYNFWNPVQPQNTILGIILEKMPSWGVGRVDETMFGKYRTYEVANQNLYDLMKGTLQESYGCIFEFDTINRLINVRDVSSRAVVQPIYISLDNLAKEISITEETENIFTCLDVNGADGVNIRSVNPTGTNTIYDLSYFMTTDNFSQELIDKWNSWVQGVESRRREYYNLVVENSLLLMQIETEKAALIALQGELMSLESQMAAALEASLQGIEIDLTQYHQPVINKKNEIQEQEQLIAALEDQLDESYAGLVEVNESCSWRAHGITSDQEQLYNRYIKEDSIEDSSFVAPAVDSYVASGDSFRGSNVSVTVENGTITGAPLSSGKMVYAVRGGTARVMVDGETKLSGNLIQGAFDTLNNAGTICLYLETGCVTVSGAYALTSDCAQDVDVGGGAVIGSTANMTSASAGVYITTQLTAYAQRAVEWDLYEYGREVLSRHAYPSYSFSVDSGNFLAMEEFDSFRRKLKLGDKLYLNLGETFGVLQPILVGASIDFENKKLSLEFSSSFSLADSAFKLADLLDQSISMGKSIDTGKYNYNAFMNAGGTTGVQNLLDTWADLAKTQLKSSGRQAITYDDAGMRFRKWTDDSHTAYDDRQMWATSNMLAFTKDNWNTVSLAIGEFVDKNLGSQYGIVVPNLVGTLLAGSNLIIESEKQDGGVSVFRVDGDGAKLYNSQFDLVNEYAIDGMTRIGQISLHPSVGIVAGSSTTENAFYSYDGNGNIIGIRATDGSSLLSIADIGKKTPMSNFWVDNQGNVYLRGSVYADNGEFRGTVYATDGEFTGKITATGGKFKGTVQADDFLDTNGKSMMENGKWSQEHLNIKSLNINNRFVVDENGNVQLNGDISWGVNPIQYQYAKALDDAGNAIAIYNSYTVGCIYRREKLGDNLWGAWYQFIGQNGTNGINGENGRDGREIQYQYSTDNQNWHAEYRDGDIYRRERLGDDGTWGAGYQFIGRDGANGVRGVSVEKIEQITTSTESSGTNIIKVTLSDGTTAEFNIKNGAKGADGKNGENGTPGVNGASSYFHVKYSNDGVSFTANNGETLGSWMGTCVDESPIDPTNFNAYDWRKIVGEDGKQGLQGPEGKDGQSSYFYVKFSPCEDGNPMTEAPNEDTAYMGVCSTTSPTAPTDYRDYTWTRVRGEDGSAATVTHATMLAAAKEAFDSGQETWIAADEMGSPVIYGGTIYGAEFYGNHFSILPDNKGPGSLSLHGWFKNAYSQYEMLEALCVSYSSGDYPAVVFSSGCSATAHWEYPSTYFTGTVSFGGTVNGIYDYSTATPEDFYAGETPKAGQLFFRLID